MESTTTSLGVQEARRRLPELLERAAAGERFVIRRHQTPLAALMPLSGRAPSDPRLRKQQIQKLMNLQGSGRGYWDAQQRQPARPAPTPPSFVQPLQRQQRFNPQLLQPGSRVAIDGAALVAFLADAKGTGLYLEPLMKGIASGHWTGVISCVSLMRVLEGPLARGDEALAQRYAQAFADPNHWLQIPPDAAIVTAAARLRQQEPQLPECSAIELATAIEAGAAVLVSDQPALAQTGQHPVISALRI